MAQQFGGQITDKRKNQAGSDPYLHSKGGFDHHQRNPENKSNHLLQAPGKSSSDQKQRVKPQRSSTDSTNNTPKEKGNSGKPCSRIDAKEKQKGTESLLSVSNLACTDNREGIISSMGNCNGDKMPVTWGSAITDGDKTVIQEIMDHWEARTHRETRIFSSRDFERMVN